MAVDTIFICFCEDSDKNDGLKKPYYMSVGLMVSPLNYYMIIIKFMHYLLISSRKKSSTFFSLQEYVENSAKALEALKQRQAAGNSSGKVIQVAEADDD
jgi:hypothetical protein